MVISMSLRNFVLLFTIFVVFLAVSRVIEPPRAWLHHAGLMGHTMVQTSADLSGPRSHDRPPHSHMAHDPMAMSDNQASTSPDTNESKCCWDSALLSKCPFKLHDAQVTLHQFAYPGESLPRPEAGARWRIKSIVLDVMPGPPRRA